MSLILKKLYISYNWIFDDLADPRLDHGYFLMSSLWKPLAVVAIYLYLVLDLGPKLMKNRKPFNLKKFIIGYNVAQVLLNAYIVYEAAIEVLYYLDWNCGLVDYSNSPRALHVVKISHLLFLIKLADLIETFVFVLRKKFKQASFLHTYHHVLMFLTLWTATKFVAGGAGCWLALINSAVHVIMYVYYALAAIDKSWAQNQAFKKFITQIQLIQFMLLMYIYGRLLFIECAYPKPLCYVLICQNTFMILLFSDFYIKTYIKKETKKIK